jgi:hypothetical protein
LGLERQRPNRNLLRNPNHSTKPITIKSRIMIRTLPLREEPVVSGMNRIDRLRRPSAKVKFVLTTVLTPALSSEEREN